MFDKSKQSLGLTYTKILCPQVTKTTVNYPFRRNVIRLIINGVFRRFIATDRLLSYNLKPRREKDAARLRVRSKHQPPPSRPFSQLFLLFFFYITLN